MLETNNQFNTMPATPGNRPSRKRAFVIAGILIICLVAAGVYAYKHKSNKAKQNTALTKHRTSTSSPISTQLVNAGKGYPSEHRLSVISGLPPAFPTDVWINNQQPIRADVVTRPTGAIQATAVYTASSSIASLVDQIKTTLTQNGWSVSQTSVNDKVGIISAIYGADSLIVTVVSVNGSSQATFQLTVIDLNVQPTVSATVAPTSVLPPVKK